MNGIRYVKASERYAASYCRAVDSVARERTYLAATVGFPEESTIAFVQNIERNNLAQYYALDGDSVVGWCDVLPKGFEGLDHVGVLGMGVLAPCRGRGIGGALLRLALEHAKKVNGLEKVELEVFASNTVALGMYQRAGFLREGERIDARKLDGRYDNIILMGKRL
ncbi:MAG: GNAT family N-acetyltransferase [Spirochaetes bacterium]|nr:GNAT family N-acetyltransferase [Spirochaetota bacterium]